MVASNYWSPQHEPDTDDSLGTVEASRQRDTPVVTAVTIRNLRHRQFTNCGELWADQDPSPSSSGAVAPRRPRLRIIKGQQSMWVKPLVHDVGKAAAYSKAEPLVVCDKASAENTHLRVSQPFPENFAIPGCLDVCRKSPQTIEIDRLLQSNDEDLQNIGLQKARKQQSKNELTLLMVCYRKGICESILLEKIIEYFRIQFVVSYSDHYCELCNVTVETALLGSHLQYGHHCALLASLARGDYVLVSHEAIAMSKQRDESVRVSLSRFRDGLGIRGRFCSPLDCKLAKNLRQVKTLDFPEAFVKEMLPPNRSLWVTPADYNKMNSEYQQKKRMLEKGSRGEKCTRGLLGSLALPLVSQHVLLPANQRGIPRAPCPESSVEGVQDSSPISSTPGKLTNSSRTHHARAARGRIPHREVVALSAEEEFKKSCLGMTRRGDNSPSHTSMTGIFRVPPHPSYGFNIGR